MSDYIKKKSKYITKKKKEKDDWSLTTALIEKVREKIKDFDEQAKNKNLKKSKYITRKSDNLRSPKDHKYFGDDVLF